MLPIAVRFNTGILHVGVRIAIQVSAKSPLAKPYVIEESCLNLLRWLYKLLVKYCRTLPKLIYSLDVTKYFWNKLLTCY